MDDTTNEIVKRLEKTLHRQLATAAVTEAHIKLIKGIATTVRTPIAGKK